MNIWIPIVVAIISGIFGQSFVQLIFSYKRRRLKNLLNAVETKSLLDQARTDFKEKFILPDFEENYFYVQTGIKTNYKSIEKYINLKNTLSDDFTWDIIKQAKQHFEFKDSELKVTISKLKRLYKKIFLIIGLLFFITSLFLAFYLNNYEMKTLEELILYFYIIIIPLFFGYITVNSVQSLIYATMIEKKLNKLKTNNLPPTAN